MTGEKKASTILTGTPRAGADRAPSHAPNMAAMTSRLGLETVPAAWPTGVSHLALAINTCHHCGATDVCSDWLARAPNTITTPPPFCPNAQAFQRAKDLKK